MGVEPVVTPLNVVVSYTLVPKAASAAPPVPVKGSAALVVAL